MNVINRIQRSTRWLLTGALLGGGAVSPAHAAVQEITAVFRPDPSNPLSNKFINTTPESGVCPWHIPDRCKELGIFSIRTNDINFTANKAIVAGHASERDGAMFKVPSAWRSVEVMHRDTGERQTVEMRIAGIGNRWDIRSPAIPSTHAWGNVYSMWQSAPSPCLPTGYIANAPYHYTLWFWRVPENAGTCSRRAVADISALRYAIFEYAYELKTPNPLTMSSGQYTGSLSYSLGPHQDFDFGDVMIPNDSLLTFNMTLNVEHTLKVEIPPGGHRVELLPQGGWQAWLNQGRKPTRLFRDQTFNVSASSRFKMKLECQIPHGGNTCALREPNSGHSVPLNVSVSLPNGLVDAVGQPVNRRPLLLDGSGTELFQPGFYVDRKPAKLHFEIVREHVETMLTGDEKTYSGNVTVVWDSEV
ncbi:hypothetical protein QIW53_08795 [Pseudomonas fluorescens]|uniref:hypothetical protein n=1 Tax=Pseudomonas fluorescens TaxID=294 RepID=UPI0035266574